MMESDRGLSRSGPSEYLPARPGPTAGQAGTHCQTGREPNKTAI